MKPRVAILHTPDTTLARGVALDSLAVRSVLDAAGAVAASCRQLGWRADLIPAAPDPHALLEQLRRMRCDVVFNLVESLHGDARFEAAVAWALEWVGVPYTGSAPLALALALEKPVARAILRDHGIAVPRGRRLERWDDSLAGLRFPCIVKPTREDGSHGIESASVVANRKAARLRARHVIESYGQPALVEEYVEGREFNVGVLGEGASAQVLPLAEIDFSELPPELPRVVTYSAKWEKESAEYRGTLVVAALEVEPARERALAQSALTAYQALGLRDYGRVDLRLPVEGRPVVVDVNPNPDLTPGCGVALAASRGGIDHAGLVERIVTSALERGRRAAADAAG